ncbi:type I restriction enzyme HsdR N-terminal domain-containing protein [Muriicola sp. Z0-33]|uniref:type I restriction enzyme HsdR N-terminal domain-containing protein n=1 Tax=Muriicola sp. Z0-33 TaxID=2816957 RepID=UPI002238A6F6|nr:type I restriction enzyme HsdR N-terminal domain-containing protein [Muriicola sp. Z0-33]MCW5515367.1 type I restriction enzyme HsdR N-terminal domain-containing protein [Muriicola sp. Z0-33]
MQTLNFPSYNFRFKNSENKVRIFDIIRKKFVVLQPEEWVRQHTIHMLIQDKHYPASLINVEKLLEINGMKKRYDIVVYNPDGGIRILVECKAPAIAITQEVFDQIARYNMTLNASYLMVTNGHNHIYCQMDYEKEKYSFLQGIPDFSR